MSDYIGHCDLTSDVGASVLAREGMIAIHAGGDLSISICWIHPEEAREFARLLINAADIAERKRQQGEA